MAKLPMLKSGLKMVGQRIQAMQQTRNPEAEQRIRGRKWMAIRSRILERDYGLCQECRRKGRITIGREVDHIKALINGGSNQDDNLECICADCHAKKTDADLGNKTRATIGADGWPKQEANTSPVWMRKGYK